MSKMGITRKDFHTINIEHNTQMYILFNNLNNFMEKVALKWCDHLL